MLRKFSINIIDLKDKLRLNQSTKVDSEALCKTIKTNPSTNTQRMSAKFDIS